MSEVRQDTIRRLFEMVWEGCGLFPRSRSASFHGDPLTALKQLYDEPPRAHHNWNHVVYCIKLATEYRLAPAAIMALFYHDCVFVPGSQRNEEDSVVRLREHFSEDFPIDDKRSQLDLIAYLIMATKHDGTPGTLIEAYVRDIDMSILGRSPAEFAIYDQAIRQEHVQIPDEVYEKGRLAFLSALTDRARIFYTTEFHHDYEAQARFNIAVRLRQGSGR